MITIDRDKTIEIVLNDSITVSSNDNTNVIEMVEFMDNYEELIEISTNNSVSYYMRWGTGESLEEAIWTPYQAIGMALDRLETWHKSITEESQYYISFKLIIKIEQNPNELIEFELENILFDDIEQPSECFKFYDLSDTMDSILKGYDRGLLNPYTNQDPAVQLKIDIVKGTSDARGFEVVFFKVGGTEVNHTFKTFTKYNVTDIKKINVMVPNSDFKQKILSYGSGEISFEEKIEIHIDRTTFEQAFGSDKMPEEFDYIFFPQLGRVYDLGKVFEDSEFMNYVYWYQCFLSHHIQKSNVEGEDKAVSDAKDDGEIEDDFNLDAIRDFGIKANANHLNTGSTTGNFKTEIHSSTNADLEGIDATQITKYHDRTLHEKLREYVNKSLFTSDYSLPYKGGKLNDRVYSHVRVPRKEVSIQYLSKLDVSNSLYANWFAQYFFKITHKRSHAQFEAIGIRTYYHRTDSTYKLELYLDDGAGVYNWVSVSEFTGLSDESWYSSMISVNNESKQIEFRIYIRTEERTSELVHSQVVDIPYTWNHYTNGLLKEYPIVFNGGSYNSTSHRVYVNSTLDDIAITRLHSSKNAHITNSIIIDNVVNIRE